jgi:hypothetical protein
MSTIKTAFYNWWVICQTIDNLQNFRCLPEIIGYSNKYVYNSDIVPQKQQLKNFRRTNYYTLCRDNLDDRLKPLIVQK